MKQFMGPMICNRLTPLLLAIAGALGPIARAADNPPAAIPLAADWVSLADRLDAAYQQAKKEDKKLSAGVLWAPLVSVDRTDGTLMAFPQSGALWISRDRGQSFQWLNRDVANWGFNESPTNLSISPEGKKIHIFSSERSGFSLDGGQTWKYMNFKLRYGFEDGQVNWRADAKTIVARSHTWPSRMWLSRDAGESFTEFTPDIMKQTNTQNIALLDDDVMLFQSEKLMRTDDYAQTLTEIPPPQYVGEKKTRAAFIGLSRRFESKVYWLNTTGVYTAADKGKTWNIVGQPFPDEWIQKRLIKSGPLFGKNANHMLVLCATHVAETLDAGQSWHVLAELPTRLHDEPYAFSFAYDPIADILYCNNRGHSGGPFLFGRLALKRWGNVEQIPPTAPSELQAEILPAGNAAKLRWKPSTDASGVHTYRVYIDGALTYQTDQPEIVLSNYAWNQELKIAIQAIDAWQNQSAKVETTVRLGDKPANATFLKDLKPTAATFDDAPMEILTGPYVAADKSTQPLSFLIDGYEPSPIPRYVRKPATNAFGIRIKPAFKQGLLEYNLDQKYTRLLLDAGMSNSAWDRAQVKILVDGKEVAAPKPFDYETRIRHIGRKAESLDIDLSSAKSLRIEIKIADARYWQEDVLVLGNAILIERK